MRQLHIFLIFCFTIPVYAQISIQEQSEGFLIEENNKSVIFYQVTPKSHDGKYERTNYVHPLWNVDGTILTEDFPEDHLHQRGVFWAWHQILIDGKRIGDGWALENYEQEVVDTDWKMHKNGSGTLSTQVNWKSDLYTRDGKVETYIQEDTDITVHPHKDNYRRIDFEIRLMALDEPVSIGGSEDEKGYSGFSVRMKLPDDVRFSGPGGVINPQTTAVESPGYVNISATFDGDHPGGVLMLDHPDNPGYPQSWILRTKKSMQNAKYPGPNTVTITQDNPLVLRYSLVTYEGKLTRPMLEKITEIN